MENNINFYVVNFFATPIPDYSLIIEKQASNEITKENTEEYESIS